VLYFNEVENDNTCQLLAQAGRLLLSLIFDVGDTITSIPKKFRRHK